MIDARIKVLTDVERNSLRSQFLSFAMANGWHAGSDEGGYHDDEPIARSTWIEWVAYARAKKQMLEVIAA